MLNFLTYFKNLLYFLFFSFMFLYGFAVANYVNFNSFVDEEIVIFVAISVVSFLFLKLNLSELSSGVSSRIDMIEAEFKKNYKTSIENLSVLEIALNKLKLLSLNVQKTLNFSINEHMHSRFRNLEKRFLNELVLFPFLNFLRQDFLDFIALKKNYRLAYLNTAFSSWNKKKLFQRSFLLKV